MTLTAKKIYTLSTLVAMVNVLFSSSKLMYIIVIIEVILLMKKILKRDYIGYLCYYIIFICLSIEFDVFVKSETLYSLKTIRIMGLNMGVWLLMPFLVNIIVKYKFLMTKLNNFKVFKILGRYFLYMNLIASFVGIFALLLNENNIQEMEDYFSAYVENAYSFFLQPLLMFAGFLLSITYNVERLHDIGITLHSVLIGNIVMMITSIISGIKGQYGITSTAASSSIATMVCFLVLYPFMDDTNNKLFNTMIGGLGVFLLLTNKQSGKVFLVLPFILLLFVGIKLKNKFNINTVMTIFVFSCLSVLTLFILEYMSGKDNVLFNSKIHDAIEVFSINHWNMNYILNMGTSIRVRFGEFIDLFYEYIHKPWFVLTGKGYGGTIKDWSGILYLTPRVERSAAFSLKEYANGTFFNVHEIVTPLLAFGSLSVFFYLKCIKYMWKYINKNFWLIIAIFWFPIYYGYSFTMGIFGVACLYYGLILCTEHDYIVLSSHSMPKKSSRRKNL